MIGYIVLVIGAIITFSSSVILKKLEKYSENRNLILKLIGLLVALIGMLLIMKI